MTEWDIASPGMNGFSGKAKKALKHGFNVVGDIVPFVKGERSIGDEVVYFVCAPIIAETPKANEVISFGQHLYWDDTNGVVTTTAGTLKRIGYATSEAAASADTLPKMYFEQV